MRFKVGDWVKIVNHEKSQRYYEGRSCECLKTVFPHLKNGMVGKIILVNGLNLQHKYGVEFIDEVGGHTCGERGKVGQCWWLPAFFLNKIPRKEAVLYAL